MVKTLGQRSLIVGVVFGTRRRHSRAQESPTSFIAPTCSASCWVLGIALGSMAIHLIRHLTGGGWGVVIRRIQGAAMRTLPLLSSSVHPDDRLQSCSIGSTSGRNRSTNITDKHLHDHLVKNITRNLSQPAAASSNRARSFISLSGIFFPSSCQSGRSKPTSLALPITPTASKPSPAPASSSTDSPFLRRH